MHNQSKKDNSIMATVTESLPNTFFKVRKDPGADGSISEPAEILCYLSGKMRLHWIKVLIGDRVVVELDPYGGKGRITKRL
jgi:translation initiation factor IF-1